MDQSTQVTDVPVNGVMQTLRIFVVDDHAMIRAGFRSLLSRCERMEVVGDSGAPRQALERIEALRPDIVLLDISMPGLSGIDAIPLIRKACPNTKIVMLTHHEGEIFVEQSLNAGADGYLSKDSDPAELMVALHSVQRGDVYLSPRVTGTLVHRSRHAGSDGPVRRSRLESLTPREREVFQLLALGKSNKEVAHALKMRVATAKKHRENLQRKVDCHSAAELALLAIREGLLG